MMSYFSLSDGSRNDALQLGLVKAIPLVQWLWNLGLLLISCSSAHGVLPMTGLKVHPVFSC